LKIPQNGSGKRLLIISRIKVRLTIDGSTWVAARFSFRVDTNFRSAVIGTRNSGQ
jgi:hypothetical protein